MADSNEIGNLIINIGAEVAQLRSDMGQAVGILKSSESTLSKVASGIGLGIGAAITAATIEAIKGLPEALSGAVHRGEELGSIADAFQNIGGSSAAIEQAKDATLGLVSSFDLMKIANEGLLAGIPDLNNQFATLTDYAARLADATGRDTKEAIDSLMNALATGAPKALAAQKIVVDTEKAYRTYATALNLNADTLTKLQQKEAVQFEALSKIEEKLQTLAPVSGSVANSMDAVGVSMDEVTGKFDIALNSNVELQRAFDDLKAEIDKVDFTQLATDIGSVAAAFVDIASNVLPRVIQYFHEFAIGLDTVSAAMARMQGQNLAERVMNLGTTFEEAGKQVMEMRAQTEKLANLQNLTTSIDQVGESIKKATSQKDIDALAPKIAEISTQAASLSVTTGALHDKLASVNAEYGKAAQTLPEVADANARIRDNAQHAGDVSDAAGKKMEAAAKKAAAEAKRAAEEVAKLKEKWNETFRSLSEEMLDEEIDLEIKNVELTGVSENIDKLIDEKAKLIGEKLEPALKEAVEKGVLTPEQADKAKEIMIKRGIKPVADAYGDALQKKNDEIADDLRERMEDALDGIESGLGDIASHFGLDIGDELSAIFKSKAVKDALAGLFDQIGQALGGVSGALVGETVSAAVDVIGDSLSAKSEDKKTKSNAGTGKAVGGAVGTAIGAYFGNPALGKAIGAAFGTVIGGMFKWGPQNPQTIARHAFANWIEDQFHKLDEVSFLDAKGKVKTFLGENFNFVEGATDRFNKEGWGDKFKEWGANATQVFKGLGQALEETLGLTEEVGDQIGLILGDNLSGSVDNARYLVQLLQLDMNDMINKLVEAGVRGEMSWLEVTSSIAGIQEAFKPGLEAMGDFGSAFDHIIDSGGQGYDAIKALKDISVEAGEAGIKNLDQLKQSLLAAGKSPEYVESLFKAISQAGITTLQGLQDASTQTLGSIIAGMEAGNETLADSWGKMRDEIEGIGQAIEDLPDSKHIDLEVTTKLDKPAEEILGKKSGTFTGGQDVDLTKVKETGQPTSNLTRSSISGTSYKGTNLPRRVSEMSTGGKVIQLNVDARNASPGVETQIMRALAEVEDRVISRTLEFVASQN